MKTLLITGANRGLGLEFCRQYAEQGQRVLACCRKPEQASALQKLAETYTNISIHALDVTDFQQIDSLAAELSNETIDVLLCNAGVYGDKPEHRFGALNYENWQHTLLINTFAPVKLTEAFLPHLTPLCWIDNKYCRHWNYPPCCPLNW